MNKLKCLKCNHEWLPRINERPLSCPNCKTRNWDVLGYSPCDICKRKFLLIDIHHIDGNRSNNTKENILRLCKDCHSQIHHPTISKKPNDHKRKIRDYKNKPDLIQLLNKYRNLWFLNKQKEVKQNGNK